MSQIQPLRIQKGTPSSSPTKANGAACPLAELSPMAGRRNSPGTQNIKKQLLGSSPFDTSPFASKFSTFTSTNSPHTYWQSRESPPPGRSNENRDPNEDAVLGSKRPSVENLKRASRVSKSNIFALEAKHEYDPMSAPLVERPLASGRALNNMPLGLQARNSILDHNRFFEKRRAEDKSNGVGESRPESPTRSQQLVELARKESPVPLAQSSPTKSAMSSKPRYSIYDPDTSLWSEADETEERKLPPGKGLHRHAKSVTFNASPPEVQEYEQVTPDPSVSAHSRESSYDDDEEEYVDAERQRSASQDSFDEALEDTDKTPVVLPEDWRFMSPEIANTEPITNMDDPFSNDDMNHQAALNAALDSRLSPTRTDSMNSNGSRRPLPPLPPPSFPHKRSDSHSSLEAVAERVSTAQRSLPSPPRAASISKEEIRNIGSSSMSLEDRLQLMSVQEQDFDKTPRKAQDNVRERRMRRKSGFQNSVSEHEIKIFEDLPHEAEEEDMLGEMNEFQAIPRISRDSILRKVKSQKFDEYKSPEPESPQREALPEISPDEPIRSYEESPSFLEGDDHIKIKQEDEDIVDMYNIPAFEPAQQPVANSQMAGGSTHEDDTDSQYSTNTAGEHNRQFVDIKAPPTPRAAEASLASDIEQESKSSHRMSLPQFPSMLSDDFGLSLSTYMTPSPRNSISENKKQDILFANASSSESQTQEMPLANRSFASEQEDNLSAHETVSEEPQRVQTPELPRVPGYTDDELRQPSTPDSVIRRSISDDSIIEQQEEIPQPAATVRVPSGAFKTRASLTPRDALTMAQTRRQVSGSSHNVPAIPERHAGRPSMVPEADSMLEDSILDNVDAPIAQEAKQQKRKSSLLQLEMPVDEEVDELSFGLDKEFDRVIEAQKVAFASLLKQNDLTNQDILHHYVQATDTLGLRGLNTDKLSRKQKGYLMRQNTKVVVASSASSSSTTTTSDDSAAAATAAKATQEMPPPRGTRSAGNSPVKKQKHETSGAWMTHEWNGKIRRKSIRQSGGLLLDIAVSGAVPPLPGMASNVTGMGSLEEEDEMAAESPEGAERGRLFVRVVGVKDLNLPLTKNEKSYFALTLDNGMHCVTTSWLELNKNAPIGQEFELVVLKDLEFQLTLQTKLEQPKPAPRPESPTKASSPTKKQGFGRFFGSPNKKKREQELKEQQERLAKQRQQDQARAQPSAWDLLHNVVGKDGSFARAYISLKEHESQAFGRPLTIDVPCFNEWAVEERSTISSTRSGKSTTTTSTTQRKAPYKIGKLELQLLYVPKPKDAKDDDMPKSMNACIREMQEAEKTSSQTHEGFLSQQGGDCPYWRRRLFRLSGSKLTAFHETTRQPRATINLAKAQCLIDDKSNLKQQTTSTKSGSRRKSAFGSEEEGYMFLEEGFRVRFANGETIDFYAENVAQKDEWMAVLCDVVGRDSKGPGKGWTDIVLKREQAAKKLQSHREVEYARRKASAEAKAKAYAQAQANSAGVVPAPRSSSKDTGRRPVSQQGSRPAMLKQGEVMGPPAPPPKERVAMTPAERRAKAKSTYY